MSVYVKGMEMPDDCRDCPFENYYNGITKCFATGKAMAVNWRCIPWEGRAEWCPLVDVPKPHGRLIDADATMKQWGLDKATKYGNENAEQQNFSYSSMMMYEVVDILDDAPTVIEAEDE